MERHPSRFGAGSTPSAQLGTRPSVETAPESARVSACRFGRRVSHKPPGEPARPFLRVGSENGQLVRHAHVVRRKVVAHGWSGVVFRERGAGFPRRLYATASTTRSRLGRHCVRAPLQPEASVSDHHDVGQRLQEGTWVTPVTDVEPSARAVLHGVRGRKRPPRRPPRAASRARPHGPPARAPARARARRRVHSRPAFRRPRSGAPGVAQPLDALELPVADRVAEPTRKGHQRRQQPSVRVSFDRRPGRVERRRPHPGARVRL